MRLRDVYLLNGQALNDSDTVTVDLARSLKILYLRIQYQAQNGTTSNTLCKINGSVSKLQVIDGSNVLTSLSMREAQAKNCFDYRRMPFQVLSEDDDIVLYEEAIIDFRRWQGDTAFYLDTSVYQSPQLQLTHNLPISATAGFVTGTGKLTVIARVIDSGAPSRLGFVSAKEIDSFSSATAGDHNTDLPLDFPIAAIMVGDPVDANTPDNYLSNFKLTADTDSFIPINSSYADLLRQNLFEYGEFEQSIDALPDTTATLLGDLYYRTRGYTGPVGATSLGLFTAVAANSISIAMTTGGAAVRLAATLRGQAPHGSVIYKFGDGWSPDQIFTPQGVGKFQLKLTSANTGATPKVVVVQQRS